MAINDLLCVTSEDGTTAYIRVDSSGNLITSGTSGTTSAEGGHVYLADSKVVGWGADQDMNAAWDGSKFAWTQATPNSAMHFGVSGAGIDLVMFGDTAGYDCTWDQSANSLLFADNALLVLGTGSDDSLSHNGTLTLWTHTTGLLVIDNTTAASATVLRCGTDTTATGFEFRNNSDAAMWSINPISAAAGRLIAPDNSTLVLGTGADDTLTHNGTQTSWTHTTGDLLVDNQSATGMTLLDLGTDTSATGLKVRSNAGLELLVVGGDGIVTVLDGVSGGTARRVGGRVACITAAGTSHTNSTDEAVLASYSIPANTIKAGTVVKARFQARVTADNGGTTLTGRLRFGTTTLTGTELIVSSAVDTSAGHVFGGEFTLIGRAAPGAAAAVVGVGSFTEPGAVGGAVLGANLNTTNFATNGALLLELTADWSAADANAVQAEIFVVEIVG